MVKTCALVALPPALVTTIFAVEAPAGTVTSSAVSSSDEGVALAAPNETEVTPYSPVPITWTGLPGTPLAGEKDAITGRTLNDAVLVAEPRAVVTVTGPVIVPGGTTAWTFVALTTLNEAVMGPEAPENATPVTSTNPVPVMVTLAPCFDAAGENAVTVSSVKLVVLVATPPGVVTLTLPVIAVSGTTASMAVSLTTVYDRDAAVPKSTCETSVSAVPVRRTVLPDTPLDGVNPLSVGTTLNALALSAEPSWVATLIAPVVAPAGTTA